MRAQHSTTRKKADPASHDALLQLVHDESDAITASVRIVDTISRKHRIDPRQVTQLLELQEKNPSLPLRIFRSPLAPLETVVTYLRDVLGKNFSVISSMLRRSETTIRTTYGNAKIKEKHGSDRTTDVKDERIAVPVSLFSYRRLSVLESLCTYLKEKGLSYRRIGDLLGRNERTVWTCVHRAREKGGHRE